ncbi:Hypothetical protein GLP15_1812 [Giardia lamblia P15]|uniref:Uncharacterized protein n=1 Tax=Giardia intestinalis (strain P15) TaxID=658858 RepID=E1EW66_GIAIA|nr:Hypothetical protein GLP15_1812 [Giardia lamblia P15]
MPPHQQTDSLQGVIRRYIADMQTRGCPPKDILGQIFNLTLDAIFPSGPSSTSSSPVAPPQAPPPTAEETKKASGQEKESSSSFSSSFSSSSSHQPTPRPQSPSSPSSSSSSSSSSLSSSSSSSSLSSSSSSRSCSNSSRSTTNSEESSESLSVPSPETSSSSSSLKSLHKEVIEPPIKKQERPHSHSEKTSAAEPRRVTEMYRDMHNSTGSNYRQAKAKRKSGSFSGGSVIDPSVRYSKSLS